MSHNRSMDVSDKVDDLEVAVGDDAVREGWDKYSVKVGETVATASPTEDGAGACYSVELPVLMR